MNWFLRQKARESMIQVLEQCQSNNPNGFRPGDRLYLWTFGTNISEAPFFNFKEFTADNIQSVIHEASDKLRAIPPPTTGWTDLKGVVDRLIKKGLTKKDSHFVAFLFTDGEHDIKEAEHEDVVYGDARTLNDVANAGAQQREVEREGAASSISILPIL